MVLLSGKRFLNTVLRWQILLGSVRDWIHQNFYAKFNFAVINRFLMTNLLVVPQRGEDSWENTISCKFLKFYVIKMRIVLRNYASKSSRILTRLLLIARGLSHITFIRSYIRATNHSSRFAYVIRQCWKVSLAGGCLLPACGVKLTGARREGGSVFSFPPRVSCVFEWLTRFSGVNPIKLYFENNNNKK
jgi:hypothetical protein